MRIAARNEEVGALAINRKPEEQGDGALDGPGNGGTGEAGNQKVGNADVFGMRMRRQRR